MRPYTAQSEYAVGADRAIYIYVCNIPNAIYIAICCPGCDRNCFPPTASAIIYLLVYVVFIGNVRGHAFAGTDCFHRQSPAETCVECEWSLAQCKKHPLQSATVATLIDALHLARKEHRLHPVSFAFWAFVFSGAGHIKTGELLREHISLNMPVLSGCCRRLSACGLPRYTRKDYVHTSPCRCCISETQETKKKKLHFPLPLRPPETTVDTLSSVHSRCYCLESNLPGDRIHPR